MGLSIAADVALLEALGPCIPAFIPPPGLFPSRARKKQHGLEKPRPPGPPRRPQPFLLHLENFSASCSAGTVLPAVASLPAAVREPRGSTDESGVRDAPAPQAADVDVPLRYMQLLGIANLTTTVDLGAQSLDVELEDLVLECKERPEGTAVGSSEDAPAEGLGQAQPSSSTADEATHPSVASRVVESRDGSAVPASCREAIQQRWDEYGRAVRGTEDGRSPAADRDRAGPASGPRTSRLLHLAQVSAVVAPLSAPAPPHGPSQSVAIEIAAAGVSACFDAAAVLGSAATAETFVKTVTGMLPPRPASPPAGPADNLEDETPLYSDGDSGTATSAGDRSPGDRQRPAVQVAVRVADVNVRAPLADTVEWGIVIEGASVVSGSRSAALEGASMCLNGRRLIYVGAASIEGVRLPGDQVRLRALLPSSLT